MECGSLQDLNSLADQVKYLDLRYAAARDGRQRQINRPPLKPLDIAWEQKRAPCRQRSKGRAEVRWMCEVEYLAGRNGRGRSEASCFGWPVRV